MDINAIFALFASKPSRKALIVCTIAVMLILSKFVKFYKPTAKAVAYEGLVGQLDSLTTQPLSIVRAASQKAQRIS